MFTKRILHGKHASSQRAEKCACKDREQRNRISSRTIITGIAGAAQEGNANHRGAEVNYHDAGDHAGQRGGQDIDKVNYSPGPCGVI